MPWQRLGDNSKPRVHTEGHPEFAAPPLVLRARSFGTPHRPVKVASHRREAASDTHFRCFRAFGAAHCSATSYGLPELRRAGDLDWLALPLRRLGERLNGARCGDAPLPAPGRPGAGRQEVLRSSRISCCNCHFKLLTASEFAANSRGMSALLSRISTTTASLVRASEARGEAGTSAT